jgi:putative ABC transport system permease protein
MMLTNLWQDIRYGTRILRRSPGFTLVAVLTLAVGIGANAAIFTVVNAILLRPLPYPQPDRLVRIYESNPKRGIPVFSTSPTNFADWQQQNTVFSRIAVYDGDEQTLTGNGDPVVLSGFKVSQTYLPTLGVQLLRGRNFTPDEDRPDNDHAVIITERLWRTRFGADPDILGKAITLDQKARTIIGITPASFNAPFPGDYYVPSAFTADEYSSRGAKWLAVVARLKPAVSLQQAESEMKVIAARIEKLYPDKAAGWTIVMKPLHETVVGRVRTVLLTVMAAVGMVLLIACANVANLLLARGTARRSELAIRTALGASRARLIAQMLTESVLLALLGGAAGLALAFWIARVLLALAKNALPRLYEVHLDTAALLYTSAISVVTGIVFGLLPAFRSTSGSTEQALRDNAAGMPGGTARNKALRSLVVSEIALTLVLLVGAGLLIRTVASLMSVEPGFDTSKTLTFRLALPESRYPDKKAAGQTLAAIMERLRALPGVQAATMATYFPISGNGYWTISVEVVGRPVINGEEVSPYYRVVDPAFRETLKIPLKRGRFIEDQDREGAPLVMVVNESFVRRLFPNEDPIGKEVKIGDRTPQPRRIVGVVADVKEDSLNEPTPPVMYISILQRPQTNVAIALRATGDEKALLAPAREIIRSVDHDLPLTTVQTMEQILAESMEGSRFAAIALGFFAAVALFLAMVGIYGVMSYAVTQRTREVGIRMALGAQRTDVRALFLRDSSRLTLLGIGIGVAMSLAAVRLISTMLFGVKPLDLVAFTASAVVLTVVALIASYIPARRASAVDPMEALRYE